MDITSLEDTETEVTETTPNPQANIEIPYTLREFGEVPKGFVSVYIQIPKALLSEIADHGLKISGDKMGSRAPDTEKILQEEAAKRNITFDRTKSIFAYPRHPAVFNDTVFSFNPNEHVLIEAKVDPKKCLVVDADTYANVEQTMWPIREISKGKTTGLTPTTIDEARGFAGKYWDKAMTLEEYINRGWNTPDTEEYQDKEIGELSEPEVLVPTDIETSLLKMVPYDGVKEEYK